MFDSPGYLMNYDNFIDAIKKVNDSNIYQSYSLLKEILTIKDFYIESITIDAMPLRKQDQYEYISDLELKEVFELMAKHNKILELNIENIDFEFYQTSFEEFAAFIGSNEKLIFLNISNCHFTQEQSLCIQGLIASTESLMNFSTINNPSLILCDDFFEIAKENNIFLTKDVDCLYYESLSEEKAKFSKLLYSNYFKVLSQLRVDIESENLSSYQILFINFFAVKVGHDSLKEQYDNKLNELMLNLELPLSYVNKPITFQLSQNCNKQID